VKNLLVGEGEKLKEGRTHLTLLGVV